MPNATVVNTISWDNLSFRTEATIEAEGVNRKEYEAAVAKVGQLTARTSVSVGTLTMATGHGITTASKLTIGWINPDGSRGCRYDVLVGTVSSLSVPFTAGTGDDLPANMTAVTAQVPHVEGFLFTGDSAKYLGAKCTKHGVIEALLANDTVVMAVTSMNGATGGGYQWYDGVSDNPLAGASITKLRFSNLNSTSVNTLVFGGGYD